MRLGEVVELLGRVPVFSTLERGDLEQIAQLAVPRSFVVGEVVFREGDASDTCYIVREGRARAVRTYRDGRTITLARFGPGDIFGELALFEDERRSATVEAIEPTSVVGVLGPDMRRLLSEHAEISSRMVIALGRRLRETNERLARQSFQTVQSRVAVVQIAGLVARRIVCWVKEGQEVGAGERIGMIRFGSRLDVYLPAGNRWRDAWNPEKTYAGGQTISVTAEPYQLPLFIRAGSSLKPWNLNQLWMESVAIARRKLANMVEGVRQIRRELGRE